MITEYTIDLRRSSRKTFGLEIREPGVLIVRAPKQMSRKAVMEALKKHESWIERNMERGRIGQKEKDAAAPFSEEELKEMACQALEVIPPKVRYFAEKMGVTYGKITIRNQKTRWGSCSSKGNLNFNCLLMRVPEQELDYVIIHELCHRREMNHSERFWKLVEQEIPDYRERKKRLQECGRELMNRRG